MQKLFAQETIVFHSNEAGYDFFRIPAIVQLSNNNLIAFAEGRVKGSGDFGNIDIVYKISRDGGLTWSSIKLQIDNQILQAGNPAPVMDRFDPSFPKGVLYLFYNTGNNHEYEVRNGNGVREAWYVKSNDLGNTWSTPVNITEAVHHPNNPSYNIAYQNNYDWRSYANTPGHAMQIQSGKYKGRIIVAANHSSGNPQKNFLDYKAHAFFTDDHGKTFQVSSTVEIPGSNESTAAEISGGKIMMNSRNQSGDPKKRIISISSNGGETWDTSYFSSLIDPVCEGSLINMFHQKKNYLLFSNLNAVQHRDSLGIFVSNDDGQNWAFKKSVEIGPASFKGDWAAYSDLVKINKTTLGILYERNNYHEIVFRRYAIKQIIN